MIEKQLATGRYSSEDEILKAALQRLDEESDDSAAIKEAIDSLDAGEPGLSLMEAFNEARKRNAIAGWSHVSGAISTACNRGFERRFLRIQRAQRRHLTAEERGEFGA